MTKAEANAYHQALQIEAQRFKQLKDQTFDNLACVSNNVTAYEAGIAKRVLDEYLWQKTKIKGLNKTAYTACPHRSIYLPPVPQANCPACIALTDKEKAQ